MIEDKRFTGGCLCGAVRFEARGDPRRCGHCHCVQCQRSSGAGMVTWAEWPKETVAVRGEFKEFESSPGVRRAFCGTCGSTLFWRNLTREKETLDVAAGTLDEPDTLAPTDHIFVKSRRRWMPLGDGLPAYHEWPPKGG
jgi:hypothetical protein